MRLSGVDSPSCWTSFECGAWRSAMRRRHTSRVSSILRPRVHLSEAHQSINVKELPGTDELSQVHRSVVASSALVSNARLWKVTFDPQGPSEKLGETFCNCPLMSTEENSVFQRVAFEVDHETVRTVKIYEKTHLACIVVEPGRTAASAAHQENRRPARPLNPAPWRAAGPSSEVQSAG